ncbi:hypothetical protein V502_02159 [Pseudogymnoascus sp. VKM F-4520 (FW-2644)]|nr:hypothetical protein V502_02159 [Pseudogymnoascus sp. VKM F-4520 (FW-2644)]
MTALVGIAILGTALVYWTAWIYYQLWSSPLAKFPGPKLAAVSRYYELYYDGFKTHGYARKIRVLHKLYGPIVRISPYEIHINDPNFYVELGLKPKLDKYDWYYNVGDALVTTSDYKEHRQQRAVLSHFFQPLSIDNREVPIFDTVEKLCLNFQTRLGSTINLSNAYRSLSNDIITNFYFSSSNNLIDETDFASEFHRSCGGFLRLLAFIRQFPFTGKVLTSLSRWCGILLKPSQRLKSMLHYQQNIGLRVNKAIASQKEGNNTSVEGLLRGILNSSLGEDKKSPQRLHTEVLGAIIAGTEGTANVLITATFYLLSNPECCRRLQAELRDGWPRSGQPSLKQLLEFPYLVRYYR